jgi:hypothetical protein
VGTGPLTTLDGQPVYVYRLADPGPYAHLVAEALQIPDSQTIPVLLDPRFDPLRLLLVTPAEGLGVPALRAMPPGLAIEVRIRRHRPGAYRFELDSAPREPAYLFVSENYDPDWHAAVDGRLVRVVRVQYSLIGVPVPAGAHTIDLWFASPAFARGKAVTLLALLGVVAVVAVESGWRRRARTPRARSDA